MITDNQHQVIGYLDGDPEGKELTNGFVCNFTVSTRRMYNGKEVGGWFKVAAWDEMGRACVDQLNNGDKVLVIGPSHTKKAKDSDKKFTSINISDKDVVAVMIEPGKVDREEAQPDAGGIPDSDIPFSHGAGEV